MRELVNRLFADNFRYVEIAGTSGEAATLPTEGIVTGSRFICVDTGNLYLFNEAAGRWNGPFKLYESAAEE